MLVLVLVLVLSAAASTDNSKLLLYDLSKYLECGRGLEILNVELAQCYLAAGASGSTDNIE